MLSSGKRLDSSEATHHTLTQWDNLQSPINLMPFFPAGGKPKQAQGKRKLHIYIQWDLNPRPFCCDMTVPTNAPPHLKPKR